MHIAQLTEGAGIVLCALFLDINASAICVIAALIVLHELTVSADLRYASAARVNVSVEQMLHSVLEMAPVMGFCHRLSRASGCIRVPRQRRRPLRARAARTAHVRGDGRRRAGLMRRIRRRAVRQELAGRASARRAGARRCLRPPTAEKRRGM